MKTSKILPMFLAAATTLLSGASTVAAQNIPAADQPNISPHVVEVNSRSHNGGDQRHTRGRHGSSGMMRQIFVQVDANGDGAVTQVEVDAFRTGQLQSADTNRDGALTIQEFDTLYRSFTRSRMVDAFQGFDEDGDGVLTTEEMNDRFGSVVKRMDRNGDGVLNIEDHGRKGDRRG